MFVKYDFNDYFKTKIVANPYCRKISFKNSLSMDPNVRLVNNDRPRTLVVNSNESFLRCLGFLHCAHLRFCEGRTLSILAMSNLDEGIRVILEMARRWILDFQGKYKYLTRI